MSEEAVQVALPIEPEGATPTPETPDATPAPSGTQFQAPPPEPKGLVMSQALADRLGIRNEEDLKAFEQYGPEFQKRGVEAAKAERVKREAEVLSSAKGQRLHLLDKLVNEKAVEMKGLGVDNPAMVLLSAMDDLILASQPNVPTAEDIDGRIDSRVAYRQFWDDHRDLYDNADANMLIHGKVAQGIPAKKAAEEVRKLLNLPKQNKIVQFPQGGAGGGVFYEGSPDSIEGQESSALQQLKKEYANIKKQPEGERGSQRLSNMWK